MSTDELPSRVTAATTARLHMGFIDMHGGLGRKFGSIGLSLDGPITELEAVRAEDFHAHGPQAARVVECAQRFAQAWGLESGAALTVSSAIPAHSGLGSGTQLSLAVGMALSRLYGLERTPRDVAAVSARGARSGIGIGAFEQGGLLVDGGRGERTDTPPIVARMAFPEQWRVLLVFDESGQGVHGTQELSAFKALPEFPSAQAAHIARLVLMQALPAVAESDLGSFGRAISEIQRLVGDHFAAAQGGGRYASLQVAQAMHWLESQGVACIGQSSWGPTGFAVVEDEARARRLLAGLQSCDLPLRYEVCAAKNCASRIVSV